MRLNTALVLSPLSLLLCAFAANNLARMPLAQQFEVADVVLVGTFGDRTVCMFEDQPRPCIEFAPESAMKGADRIGDRRSIRIVTNDGYGERRINQLELRGKAMLFLHSQDGYLYTPVNGMYSAIKVDLFDLSDSDAAW
jgi:hypothetical protein